MAQVTFDRFDGGLLLARPSSTAPANSLSRALNVDPQPGGWMRARPSFRRTPNATLISNQFKGLKSNGGNLWAFGAGQQSQVVSVTPNIGVTTGTNTLFYAMRDIGLSNPANSLLNGVTKWGSGFACCFSGIDPSNLAVTHKTQATIGSPGNAVFFDGKYLVSNGAGLIYQSTDGENYSVVITIASATIRRMNVSAGTLFVEYAIGSDKYLARYTSLSPVTGGAKKYSNTSYEIYYGVIVSGQTYFATNDGIQRIAFETPTDIFWDQRTTGLFQDIKHNGSTFIACGDAGLIKTSPDATAWTTRTSGTSQNLRRVAIQGSAIVCVGGTSITESSNSGSTWTVRFSTASALANVESSGGVFLAVGVNAEAYKSLAGTSWATQTITFATTDINSVCFGTLGFMGAGFDAGGVFPVTFLAQSQSNEKVLFQTSGNTVTNTAITDVNMPNSGLMVTASNRIFAISDDGQNVRYCALAAPSNWTTVDSGFLPVSQHFGDGQRAYALGIYQGKLVVFTDTSIQIWKLDPDPTAIALENVIEGVGTRHHSSIVSLQGDLLFLSDSGVRSLTTLQNSLYPTDTDVGLPIKKITPSPSQLVRIGRFGQAPSCIGLAAIPFAQYWVAAPDLWDVDPGSGVKYGWASWSYSRQAKLNAWSVHSAAAKISAWTTLGSTVFARSDGDDYLLQMQPEVFGVEQAGAESAPYTAEMDTQWLDFKRPGVRKVLTGMDFDGQNVASVAIYSSLGGNREGVLMDTIAVNSNQAGWTYSGEIIPVQADGTEFKLRFVGVDGADVQVNRMTLYYDEVGLA